MGQTAAVVGTKAQSGHQRGLDRAQNGHPLGAGQRPECLNVGLFERIGRSGPKQEPVLADHRVLCARSLRPRRVSPVVVMGQVWQRPDDPVHV